ncbi:MAG TPA: zf-TFIIB domain-containing protein [Candidatus Hydrogenedentes bacterium]|nr:zf-TFIIB domain-containing protein [Candidatus Hydrogenedentota bacterium]HPO29826.1 zf-TFIIB domain-containing protein [Candidatus Hydrogenedentota bacterium]
MNCPACDEPLVTCEYANVEVDWCARCGGVWLDAGEFALLESVHGVVPPPPVALHRESARRCPACNGKMTLVRRVIPGSDTSVTVDVCVKGHGEWYDAGELESLLQVPGGILGPAAVDPLNRVFGKRNEGTT